MAFGGYTGLSKGAKSAINKTRPKTAAELAQERAEATVSGKRVGKNATVSGKKTTGTSTTGKPAGVAGGTISPGPGKAPIVSVPSAKTTAAAPNAGLNAGVGATSATGAVPGTLTRGGSVATPGYTDPYTGFARRYAPTEMPEILADPAIIGWDVADARGGGSAMQGSFGNYAEMANAVAQLIQAGNGRTGNDEQLVNSIADLVMQGSVAGGRAVDPMAMINMLLSGRNAIGDLVRFNSDSGQNTSSQQGDQFVKMLRSATGSLSPLLNQAMNARAANLAREYTRQGADGTSQYDDVFEYMRANLL